MAIARDQFKEARSKPCSRFCKIGIHTLLSYDATRTQSVAPEELEQRYLVAKESGAASTIMGTNRTLGVWLGMQAGFRRLSFVPILELSQCLVRT